MMLGKVRPSSAIFISDAPCFGHRGYEHSQQLDRLPLVSDEGDELVLVNLADGQVGSRFRLPGRNQEGLALEGSDHAYVGQDTGGILKIELCLTEPDPWRTEPDVEGG